MQLIMNSVVFLINKFLYSILNFHHTLTLYGDFDTFLYIFYLPRQKHPRIYLRSETSECNLLYNIEEICYRAYEYFSDTIIFLESYVNFFSLFAINKFIEF